MRRLLKSQNLMMTLLIISTTFMEEFNKIYSTPAHLMQSFDKDLIL
jgi:hypothetical protein